MVPSESSATTLTITWAFSVKESPSCGDVMLQVGGSLMVSEVFPPLSILFVGLSFVHPNKIARMQMKKIELSFSFYWSFKNFPQPQRMNMLLVEL